MDDLLLLQSSVIEVDLICLVGASERIVRLFKAKYGFSGLKNKVRSGFSAFVVGYKFCLATEMRLQLVP